MRIGIDIGGTKTDAVIVADDGTLARRIRVATGFGADAVVESVVTAIGELLAPTGLRLSDARSVGIGIPGTVDSISGHVSHAVNLGFDTLDLGAALEARLGIRVRIENDVKAAAVGAYFLLEHDAEAVVAGAPAWGSAVAGGAVVAGAPIAGAPAEGAAVTEAARPRSMAYLNLGTGLAAGLVLDGELWRGSWGAAGEIGHIPLDPAGAVCPCGQRGCLETVASGSGISRQWQTDDPKPAQSLFAAADAGDPYASDLRDRFIEGIASAVRILVLTVDVDTVVIGGGLSNLGRPLLARVCAVLSDWAAASPFIASLDLARRVELLPEGFPAAAVGAALVGLTTAAATAETDTEVAGEITAETDTEIASEITAETDTEIATETDSDSDSVPLHDPAGDLVNASESSS
ncbi:ROK family protein [Subtercola endophyticus]|uniref:ROK family protein n=1 Tax=Subtercola endophyticus TaxID=2895559 RepID=UPI001E4BBF27|nr:ROK family protein [Subtercola endophyticus]UFS58988.1 ROK family protein [Subtercola endophyticus]